MTSWQDIEREIQAKATESNPLAGIDEVRRNKYKLVKRATGRPLLVYATAFHNPIKVQFGAPFLSIDLSDKDGFYEITRNVAGKEVDVFIHSPGGSAEATESIVEMLRSKFRSVRFIITGAAKSAATMLALSGDSILMDRSAELGPIDPQVLVRGRYSPAGSIIEQFERATRILQDDPSQLPVWVPILQEFAPSLLVECENYINLSKELATSWLAQYMFRKRKDPRALAKSVAAYLTDEKKTLSHARRIGYDTLKKLGIRVELLEKQSEPVQDAIRQLHLVIMATLDKTGAVKIFENSEGAVMIRMINLEVTVAKHPPGAA